MVEYRLLPRDVTMSDLTLQKNIDRLKSELSISIYLFFWALIFFLQLQSLVDCLLTNAERQNADTLDGPDLTKNGKS
jgi:hypothetical protein